MDASGGFSDFRRESDGQVTAVNADGERVRVRVSIEREHRDAAGELIASGEVASSEVPEGEVGSVRVR